MSDPHPLDGADRDERPGDDPLDDVEAGSGDDALDDLREAAGAVVASLKQLAGAAEKVLEDPETFAQIAASGRAVVDAFLAGFTAEPPEPPEPTTAEPPEPPEPTTAEPPEPSEPTTAEPPE